MIVVEFIGGEDLEKVKDMAQRFGFKSPHDFIRTSVRLVMAWVEAEHQLNLTEDCQQEMQRYSDWELTRYEDTQGTL